MKICPVAAELFHADGQTDRRDEVNSRFSQFCEKRRKTVRSIGSRTAVFTVSLVLGQMHYFSHLAKIIRQ